MYMIFYESVYLYVLIFVNRTECKQLLCTIINYKYIYIRVHLYIDVIIKLTELTHYIHISHTSIYTTYTQLSTVQMTDHIRHTTYYINKAYIICMYVCVYTIAILLRYHPLRLPASVVVAGRLT